MVERDVAELYQVRPLARLAHGTRDAADLPLVAARVAMGAKHPACQQEVQRERVKLLSRHNKDNISAYFQK